MQVGDIVRGRERCEGHHAPTGSNINGVLFRVTSVMEHPGNTVVPVTIDVEPLTREESGHPRNKPACYFEVI